MQGTSPSGRRRARTYLLILAAAHMAAAGLVVFLLSQTIGAAVQQHAPAALRLALVGVASVAGIALDLRAVLRRSYSVGLDRQTPRALSHSGMEWWVTPLIWGADTGLILTTYRVSFCSWLLLVLAAVGAAPPWSGLLYGLSFMVPLLVAMSRPEPEACDVDGGRRAGPSPAAQWLGVASMVALCAGLVWLQRGPA